MIEVREAGYFDSAGVLVKENFEIDDDEVKDVGDNYSLGNFTSVRLKFKVAQLQLALLFIPLLHFFISRHPFIVMYRYR